MYKQMWDMDNWNLNSSSYHSRGYHGQKAAEGSDYKAGEGYNAGKSGDDISSDYLKKKEKEDKDKKKDREDKLAKAVEGEIKGKYKKNEEEESIHEKAAKEISREILAYPEKEHKKKNIHSIEDAIMKAIKQHKEMIVLDK